MRSRNPLTARLGVIGPLDVIDTSAYEFYLVAPPRVMFAATSVGLHAFTRAGSQAAFASLDRCLAELAGRNPDVVLLNGIPLLLYLDREQVEYFTARAAAIALLGGYTAIDAGLAAFRALGATTIAVASKWPAGLNDRLAQVLRANGFEVAGVAGTAMAVQEIKGDYAAGSALAAALARAAARDAPDADLVFLAGGSWLTLHLLEELEDSLGVPVVSGLQTTTWFALNVLGVFHPHERRGSLLRTRLTGADDVRSGHQS